MNNPEIDLFIDLTTFDRIKFDSNVVSPIHQCILVFPFLFTWKIMFLMDIKNNLALRMKRLLIQSELK